MNKYWIHNCFGSKLCLIKDNGDKCDVAWKNYLGSLFLLIKIH